MAYKKLLHHHLPLPTLLAGAVILGIFAFVIGNMRDMLFGAPLSIATVADGTTLSEGSLPISGKAKHARELFINGRSILIDREGNFSDLVLLSPGYNVVEVMLRDQFGKEKTERYHLVLDESDAVASLRKEASESF